MKNFFLQFMIFQNIFNSSMSRFYEANYCSKVHQYGWITENRVDSWESTSNLISFLIKRSKSKFTVEIP